MYFYCALLGLFLVALVFIVIYNAMFKKKIDSTDNVDFIKEIKEVTIPTVRFVELLSKETMLKDIEKNLKGDNK